MKLSKMIAAGVLSFSLLTGTSFAAPAWEMPASGKAFENAAKQIYIAQEMDKFHKSNPNFFAAPDKWTYEKFTVGEAQVERLANPKQKRSKRVVLQLHGGGYVGHLSDWYRDLAVKQAVITDAKEVYMVDYRVAPEHLYPAALDDAARAYLELLKRNIKPENIIVIGDSAGGNLALALSLYLKQNALPQPAMLILVSPRTTFETTLPSRTENANRDLVLGKNNPKMYNAVFNPIYAGKIPLNDPRLSPIYADLKDLPPMLIQIGGYEMFVDDGIELLKKATADELNVTLSVYQGMPHDFAVLLPDLQESVDSFAEIRDFVNVHMRK